MKNAGVTIFLVFFGLSLLDALWAGHWIRALFWLGMGLAFVVIGRARKVGPAEPRP